MNTSFPTTVGPRPHLFGAEPPVHLAPGTASGLFAEIVFDRPLDVAYSYAVPAGLADQIAVGKRVEAPFGKGDSAIVGYCVGVSDRPPPREAKAIFRVLDAEPLLGDDLLRLTRWMADYYLCGWGQVLQAVVPAGARDRAGVKHETLLEALPDAELSKVPAKLSTKQAQALRQLRRAGGAVPPKLIANELKITPGVVMSLIAKGYARKSSRAVDTFTPPPAAPAEPPPELTADQAKVWGTLQVSLREGGFRGFLLHGITGSGKTEIYLRAIEEVIQQGKSALVLVPEISLTPQTLDRFQGRCAGVSVLHSHLTDTERGGQWRRIAAGGAQVIVGARSAVFAPAQNLGLIVIDEEHEGSFKQEATPRYHARDVAVTRARLANVPILLGSATPSLESWHAAKTGEYTLLTLPRRVADRPLPRVELIDQRHEPRTNGPYFAVSPTLQKAMHQALDAGGQVLLLLNRRGFSTHIHCPDCGLVASCQNCDLALTFHRGKEALVCHYCGYEEPPRKKCPACGAAAIRYQGLGTEKLQAEIEAKFPGRIVARMDSDTMNKPGSHARVLDAFKNGLVKILLGTQMIAKGLDIPNVTLVGVINADTGLHIPDFRGTERTFQLLAQVAGRAGRGPKGGRVLVQTYTPEHPCIQHAAKHDFLGFAAAELAQRAPHGYPPYQKMARLIVRSQKEDAACTFADTLAGAFRVALLKRGGLRLLGPAEAPVFRLNGYFRFHFQLQSPSAAELHEVLRSVLGSVRAPSGVEFVVDVDPYGMM